MNQIYNYSHSIGLVIKFNQTNLIIIVWVRTKISKLKKVNELKLTNLKSTTIELERKTTNPSNFSASLVVVSISFLVNSIDSKPSFRRFLN